MLAAHLNGATQRPGAFDGIDGLEHLDKVVQITQQPIGRTPRSNPATYTGALGPIRDLFAAVPESRARGYKKGRFSFNVKGGRCEECEGAGVKTVEMQFLSDVQVPCEACNGARFNPETLEITYRGRTIRDVLDLSIGDAARFFSNHRKLRRILATLVDVGLSYVALGQPSTTLSGGEAQRIKLATELSKPATGRTLYILDEPTTGLHMADIEKLLAALQRLVDAGNTVLVIEHNTDVIKVADHLIDLGPEGGAGGGHIVGQGPPEQVAGMPTPTGKVLREVLAQEAAMDAAEATTAHAAEPAPPPFVSRRKRRKKGHPKLSLRGVQTHNLRNIDLDLPQGKLTVITGPSGSGKTSLAFDTLFAEGQRRYVESLSTYARRFLGRRARRRSNGWRGSRPPSPSTSGTAGPTPLHRRDRHRDLRQLPPALRTHRPGPLPGMRPPAPPVEPERRARHLAAEASGSGWLVCAVAPGTRAADLRAEGFSRLLDARNHEHDLDDLIAADPEATAGERRLVVDRLHPGRAGLERVAEGVATAYGWGGDRCRFIHRRGGAEILLTRAAECPEHGAIHRQELTPRHFSFNSHLGACPACDGLGRRYDIDPAAILPNPSPPLGGPRWARRRRPLPLRPEADPAPSGLRPLRRRPRHPGLRLAPSLPQGHAPRSPRGDRHRLRAALGPIPQPDRREPPRRASSAWSRGGRASTASSARRSPVGPAGGRLRPAAVRDPGRRPRPGRRTAGPWHPPGLRDDRRRRARLLERARARALRRLDRGPGHPGASSRGSSSCGTSAWATSPSTGRRRRCPAERPSGSGWPRSSGAD